MTTAAMNAGTAYRASQRRRTTRNAIEITVDAVLAIGGMLFANAAFNLGLGFIEGVPGMSLGLALMSAGAAWLTRNRRRPHSPTRSFQTMPARAIVPAPASAVATVRPLRRAA